MFPLFQFASVSNKFVNKTILSDSKFTLTCAHKYMHSYVSTTGNTTLPFKIIAALTVAQQTSTVCVPELETEQTSRFVWFLQASAICLLLTVPKADFPPLLRHSIKGNICLLFQNASVTNHSLSKIFCSSNSRFQKLHSKGRNNNQKGIISKQQKQQVFIFALICLFSTIFPPLHKSSGILTLSAVGFQQESLNGLKSLKTHRNKHPLEKFQAL